VVLTVRVETQTDQHAVLLYVPIIAMTANAMIGDEERCLDTGMDGYVTKPIEVEQLFATIAKVLSAKSDRQGR
jgi:CheY-like chemotaxis protein